MTKNAKNTHVIGFSLLLAVLISSCGPRQVCVPEDNLAKEARCLAAIVIPEGVPFPNSVSQGGTLNFKIKIAGVTPALTLLPATVTTTVVSSAGALVGVYTTTVMSNANPQIVPLLSNITFAAGTYIVQEINVSFDACGNKRICVGKTFTVLN